MLRFAIIFALMFSCASRPLCAQGADDKPTQILPARENLPTGGTNANEGRDRQPQITADLPLYEEVDGTVGNQFTIGVVRVEDNGLLPAGTYNHVTDPFLSLPGKPATLKALAKAVADNARSEGFIFASAKIPAQSIRAGVVRVTVSKGTVDSVVVKGPNNAFITQVFNRLEGKVGTKASIEHAISTAEDYPGISIGKLSYRRNNGRGILTVRTVEVADNLRVTFDNYGTETFGPVRARIETSSNGLLSERDWLATQLLVTPFNPSELTFASARYSHIITDGGSRVTITGAAGRTKRSLDEGRVIAKSRSKFSALTLIIPAIQTRKADFALSVEAAVLSVDRNFSNGRVRNDNVATVSASLTGNANLMGGRMAGGMAAIRGLNVLGATQANDPNASRRDGSGIFTKAEMWASWTRKLGEGFSVRTAVQGQVASRPLLSSQEIDLGGPRYGRAFDFSERSGDQGVSASFELRKRVRSPLKNVSNTQLYLFGDGGYVDNLRSRSGGGSLASAGGGARLNMGKINFGVEVAVPVKGRREFGGTAPKMNATIGLAF